MREREQRKGTGLIERFSALSYGEDAVVIPEIGDLAHATAVGRIGRATFQWSACPGCGKGRWLPQRESGRRCKSCASTKWTALVDASQRWLGGEPKLGDVARGVDIGKNTGALFSWRVCPDCDKVRWVLRKQHAAKRCMRCAAIGRNLTGERNPRWKGGVRQGKDGYRYLSVSPDHAFIGMANRVLIHGRYHYSIAEHRLVMAQHLGRPLNPWELVHHLNGIKDDNRTENLELLKSKKEHLPSMIVQRLVGTLQSRVTLLEAEVALLRSQLDGA